MPAGSLRWKNAESMTQSKKIKSGNRSEGRKATVDQRFSYRRERARFGIFLVRYFTDSSETDDVYPAGIRSD